MRVDTVKVHNPDDPQGGFMIINADDYHKDQESKNPRYELHPANESSDKAISDRSGTHLLANSGRNADGTFSEPTPTDIRYPDKNTTEYANNHGAFMGNSAAEHREAAGMEQRPGGLDPDKHEEVQEAQEVLNAAGQPVKSEKAEENLMKAKGGHAKPWSKIKEDRAKHSLPRKTSRRKTSGRTTRAAKAKAKADAKETTSGASGGSDSE
jgi:hypothetical protein